MYRATGYKTSSAVSNSAWGMLKGVDEAKLQNFTYRKKINFTNPIVVFKYIPTSLLQNKNRSWRIKQKRVWFRITREGRKKDRTPQFWSCYPVSRISADLFCPMLHGSAQEEPSYWWAERQSKGNPVATAADWRVRGRIARLALFVAFHTATLRWKRRERGRWTEVNCFTSLENICTLTYILAFLH